MPDFVRIEEKLVIVAKDFIEVGVFIVVVIKLLVNGDQVNGNIFEGLDDLLVRLAIQRGHVTFNSC